MTLDGPPGLRSTFGGVLHQARFPEDGHHLGQTIMNPDMQEKLPPELTDELDEEAFLHSPPPQEFGPAAGEVIAEISHRATPA